MGRTGAGEGCRYPREGGVGRRRKEDRGRGGVQTPKRGWRREGKRRNMSHQAPLVTRSLTVKRPGSRMGLARRRRPWPVARSASEERWWASEDGVE